MYHVALKVRDTLCSLLRPRYRALPLDDETGGEGLPAILSITITDYCSSRSRAGLSRSILSSTDTHFYLECTKHMSGFHLEHILFQ